MVLVLAAWPKNTLVSIKFEVVLISVVESQLVANISQISVTPDRQHSITVDRDIDNGQLMSPVPTDGSLCQTDSVGEIEIQARGNIAWTPTGNCQQMREDTTWQLHHHQECPKDEHNNDSGQ